MHAWEHGGVKLNMQQLFIDQFNIKLDLNNSLQINLDELNI